MSEIIDWGDASKNAKKTYPAGTYLVEITGWEYCESRSDKKTPQIRWHASIQEPVEHRGSTIIDHTPLTKAAFWKLANFMIAAGVDVSKAGKMEVKSHVFSGLLDQAVKQKMYWQVIYDPEYKNNKVEEYAAVQGEATKTPIIQLEDNACPF
jgi:hypothetical protein